MNPSSIIMYTTEDGLTKIETTFEDDTVWISIDQMAELFQRDRSVIGKHVRNIPCRYSNEDILFYFYRLDI